MTKEQIIKEWAEQKNLTYDNALPLYFCEEMRKFGVNASDFVWAYDDAGGIAGRPLSLSHFFILAMQKGNLVPFDVIDRVIEMTKSGDYSAQEIKDLVKRHCEML